MNRLNMNNIAEPITKEIEFKQQDPFLLFRNKTSKLYFSTFVSLGLSNKCDKA